MSIAHFDPLLCASLHNQIISIIAPAARTQYRNTIVRNFFAAYGEPAEAIRDRLSVSSTPLVSFLENIDIALPPAPADGNPGVGVPINFAPHLALPSPWMFEELNPGFATGDCRDEHENFVVLYGGERLFVTHGWKSATIRLHAGDHGVLLRSMKVPWVNRVFILI